jgi:hypothetical protein
MITTASDVVKLSGMIVAFQAFGHAARVPISGWTCGDGCTLPPLAKSARSGAPKLRWNEANGEAGHPPVWLSQTLEFGNVEHDATIVLMPLEQNLGPHLKYGPLVCLAPGNGRAEQVAVSAEDHSSIRIPTIWTVLASKCVKNSFIPPAAGRR